MYFILINSPNVLSISVKFPLFLSMITQELHRHFHAENGKHTLFNTFNTLMLRVTGWVVWFVRLKFGTARKYFDRGPPPVLPVFDHIGTAPASIKFLFSSFLMVNNLLLALIHSTARLKVPVPLLAWLMKSSSDMAATR